MKKKIIGKVGVLAGGESSEREISLKSGRAVCESLVREGVDAVLIDVKSDVGSAVKDGGISVAFLALHGRFGEDGTVQKLLEDMNIPYTGSGPTASRIAMDKALTKDLFDRNEIPTPRYMIFEKDDYRIEDCYDLGFPMVVKPHLEGSSIGLSVAKSAEELPAAIERAMKYGDLVLLEEFVRGRELTVGILDDEPLPVIEIVTKAGLYDYEAKYTDPDTRYIVPADIDIASGKLAQSIARKVHEAVGCSCFSRVDMIMGDNGKIFVLEVNTIPGMTERSLLPKAAEAIGLSFGKLCIKLIEDAITRQVSDGKI